MSGVRARATAPTTQRTIMVGHVTAPARFDGRSRVVAPAASRRRKGWRERGADRGGSPCPPASIAFSGPGRPPLCCARTRLLMPIAHNRIRFIAIAIRFRQIAVKTSPAGKPPLTAGSMGTYAEFVIAVTDGEFLRRLCGLHNLARYERPCRTVSVVVCSPPSCGLPKGHDRQRARSRHGQALEFDIDALNLTGQRC
jgi:hypothetical protein